MSAGMTQRTRKSQVQPARKPRSLKSWPAPDVFIYSMERLESSLRTVSGPLAGKSSAFFQDALVILGVVLALVVLLLIWARYGRKTIKKRSEYRKSSGRSTSADADSQQPSVPIEEKSIEHQNQHHHHRHRGRRKYRRRREEHRQRNPTLAETGGLPPLREAPSPPSPQ